MATTKSGNTAWSTTRGRNSEESLRADIARLESQHSEIKNLHF